MTFQGLPKKEILVKAIESLDDNVVSRDQVDILLSLVQKKEMISAV